jgi:transcription antitermination factor NusG
MSYQSEDKWVTVELSYSGQGKPPEELKNLINDHLSRDVEFFIPSTTFEKNDDQVTVSLMEGYIFVKGGHPSSVYFDMEDTPYVSKVLSNKTSSGRRIMYADNSEIEGLKDKLREKTVKNIESGDRVIVTDGVWENLEGEVIGQADPEDLDEEQLEEFEDHIYVSIEGLESIESVVTLPKAFLKKI